MLENTFATQTPLHIYRLAPLQEGMLFHTLQDQGQGVYINQAVTNLSTLDLDAYRSAWEQVIMRHSALRTTFDWKSYDQPMQLEWATIQFAFIVEDLQHLSPSEQEKKITHLLRRDRRAGFDLTRGPLLRITLLQLDTSRFLSAFTHHHIIMDGWSGNIVMNEVRVFYEAARQGRLVQLSPPPSFREYIAWLDSQELSHVEHFWRQILTGFDHPTPLPLKKRTTSTKTRPPSLSTWDLTLAKPLSMALASTARRARVTPHTMLQAAWALLLSRHAMCSDVLFGVLVSGRPPQLVNVDNMVGMFLNTIPFRTRVPDKQLLLDWLKSLKQLQVDLSEYEFTPLQQIKNWCSVPPTTPLFTTVLSRKDTAGGLRGGPRKQGGRIRKIVAQQNFPLLLEFAAAAELGVTFTYDRNFYDSATIVRLGQQLQTLLESFVNGLDSPVEQLQMLSDEERYLVTRQWSLGEPVSPDLDCLHQIVERQAERTPDAIAVRLRAQAWTFAQLNREANRLGHYLLELGAKPGSVIGLNAHRSLQAIAGVLGTLKVGAAYVPLDPSYPRDRLEYIVADSGVEIILSDSQGLALVNHQIQEVPLDAERGHAPWSQYSDENLGVELSTDDLAHILYTSGSTGQPKGVAAAHRVALARLFAEQPPFEPGEACCAKTSFNFIDSLWELFLPWLHGAPTTLIEESAVKNPERFLQQLNASRATRIVLVPSLLRALLDSGLDIAQQVPLIRYWISSGEPLQENLCWQFYAQLPNATLVNIYGTTETWDLTRAESGHLTEKEPLGIGSVIPNAKALVLDQDLGPVPIGIVGELFVGGAMLAQGYWQRPDLTAERFLPNPLATHSGECLYRTGDLVRWLPDGTLDYVGRADRQIKIRGFRIEPQEVEQILLKHPAISQAAVCKRQECLTAYVVQVDEPAPALADLLNFARQHLPEHMIPAQVVRLDKLPLTPNGKIDIDALPPLDSRSAQAVELTALAGRPPEGTVEHMVADVWQQVLGRPITDAEAHFFEAGGDSLSAIRVVARLTQQLGQPVSLGALLAAPSIAELAAWIESGLPDTDKPELERDADAEEAPLTFTQRRLWFLDQLNPGIASYTIPNMLYLHGPLDLPALRAAFADVVERHAVLRTVFRERDGEPVQIIQDNPAEIPIECIDLSTLNDNERMPAARKAAIKQGRLAWDLAHGPLYRLQLIKLSDELHILSTALHHIIADGRSMGIFGREIGLFYKARSQGAPLTLPPLPIQYADFARWERRMVEGDLFSQQLRYWKSQLANAVALELPTDHPRPAVHRFRGKKILFQISAETANAMRRLGKAEHTTTFMWLLTGFQLLLSRYCRQPDVTIGTAMWNRSRVELEKLIGLFVNTIPMRHDFSKDATLRQALQAVRDDCLAAFSNMDLPFEEMLKHVDVERDLSHQGSPLFQVMFIHQPGAQRTQGQVASGVEMERERIDTGFANFDLLLSTNDSMNAEISCMISFDVDLFEESTIIRFSEHLERLFEGFAEHPDQPVSSFNFITSDERQLLLEQWSQGKTLPLAQAPVHTQIAAVAARQPEAPAIQFDDRVLSYRQLNDLANRVANQLCALQLEPEQYVGLCVKRSPELIIGLLGILKAGATVLTIDPSYPAERIRFMREDSACQLVLAETNTLDVVDQSGSEQTPSQTLLISDLAATAGASEQEPPHRQSIMSQLAYVIYTSGSTGRPKGVMVEHGQLANIIQAQIQQFGISANDRVQQMLSLNFDAAMGEVFRTLVAGACLHMAPKDDLMPGPGLVERLKALRITAAAMSPTALAAMPDASQALPDLQTLTVGGEPCPPAVAAKWMPGRRLLNGYGPTETTIGATLAVNWSPQEKAPIGKPLPLVETYVLDEALEPSPIGIPGELYIGGAGVTRGYLNRPDVTAERFVPHPFSTSPGARLYRTGDLVRWRSDGELEFLQRIDQQIKIRGHRIELGEIEASLANAPDVRSCVVVDFEEQGLRRLAAYWVSHAQTPPTASQLRAFLSDRLPDYMVPALFIRIDRIPMTPNGKLDRRALPPPQLGEASTEVPFVAPSTELQQGIAAVWMRVLGAKQVGIDDNFFQLGGDSIATIRVISGAQEQGIYISAKQMFKHQTIRELADALQATEQDSTVGADTRD